MERMYRDEEVRENEARKDPGGGTRLGKGWNEARGMV